MRINKRKFAILLGILYSVAISADPVFHALDSDHHHDFIEIHESLDCQVCENESFKAYDPKTFEDYALVSKQLSTQDRIVESHSISGFSARAPPNS